MSAEPALRVVLCTAPPDRAEGLARLLLERRLAACVNLLPSVVSLYWWKDAIARDDETLLVVKTTAAMLPALTDAIREGHPYGVPEVIALTIVEGEGNAHYRAWIAATVAGSPH